MPMLPKTVELLTDVDAELLAKVFSNPEMVAKLAVIITNSR